MSSKEPLRSARSVLQSELGRCNSFENQQSAPVCARSPLEALLTGKPPLSAGVCPRAPMSL